MKKWKETVKKRKLKANCSCYTYILSLTPETAKKSQRP